MENNNLEKNLDCIGRYNPKLKEELSNLKVLTNNFELTETEAKEPNLSFNGLPLHSVQNAETEAKNIFNSATNSPTSMHVVFGIGLGHLFKEFCEQSKGKVIVYEPNLEILRVTLELVDFSKELFKPNVIITSDLESFKQFFMTNYIYKANATFVFLNSYRQLYSDHINDIFRQIELITGLCMSEYNTLKNGIANSAQMVLKNLPYTLNEIPLIEFQNTFKGKTALIVSAGPSLDLNIETIKKNCDKVVVFCVGTALKALIKNGIRPDFLNIMEVNDVSGQIEGIDLSDMNLILEPYTNNIFHRTKTKTKLLFATNNAHSNICWANLTNTDISQYEAKGTVSYEALASAKILGFQKIILVGQDLAYANNQCYSKDSAYSELTCTINPETQKFEVKIDNLDNYVNSLLPTTGKDRATEFQEFAAYKIDNLNKTLYFVKGISGEMIATQGGYATFIEHFKEFASNNKDLNLINSSMIGAEIEGFKNIPLGETLKDNAETVHVNEKINSVLEALPKSLNYDKKKILTNLEKELELLKVAFKDFEAAQEYIFKYEREFRRRRVITDETNRYFRLLLSLYNKIIETYQKRTFLFEAISFNEDIELKYWLQNSENVDAQMLQSTYDLLKRYYNFVGQKLVEIINIMETQKELLLEGTNSAS